MGVLFQLSHQYKIDYVIVFCYYKLSLVVVIKLTISYLVVWIELRVRASWHSIKFTASIPSFQIF